MRPSKWGCVETCTRCLTRSCCVKSSSLNFAGCAKRPYRGELYLLSLDEGSLPCLGVPGYVALVPTSRWKGNGGRSSPRRMGSKVRSSTAPRNATGAVDMYFTWLPVDKESVIAGVRVVDVGQTCETLELLIPDVGPASPKTTRQLACPVSRPYDVSIRTSASARMP